MNKKGYKLTENGEFDQATYDALKALQTKHGLEVDGILGNASWNMAWEG
jgi:peptidoglycan hydrolase-like protein with peptidoglycan-binding domain